MSELDTITFHLLNVLGLSHDSAAIVMNRIGDLEGDVARCTEVLTKVNAWVAEAKPLLEKGGEAERALAREKAERHSAENLLNDALVEIERLKRELDLRTAERDGARAERNHYAAQLSGKPLPNV